jgi:hypothetical protein
VNLNIGVSTLQPHQSMIPSSGMLTNRQFYTSKCVKSKRYASAGALYISTLGFKLSMKVLVNVFKKRNADHTYYYEMQSFET